MDSGSVISLVNEVEPTMWPLWMRNRNIVEYVTGTWDISRSLPRDLSHIETLGSYDHDYDEARMKGKLKRPMELKVYPLTQLKGDRKKGDRLEDGKVEWLSAVGFSDGGPLMDEIIGGICSRTHVCAWTEEVTPRCPVRMPGESNTDYISRCDRYYRTFFPLRVVTDPVETTGFVVRRREVQASFRHFRVQAIDFLRRWADYNRSEAVNSKQETQLLTEIAGQQFKYVAAGDPESPIFLTGASLNEYVEVMLVDDNHEISVMVQGLNANGRRDEQWHEVVTRPNLYGSNSLALATGSYKTGVPLAYRYNPLMLPQIRALRTRDSLRSLLNSLMHMALKMNVIEAGDAVGAAWLGIEDSVRQQIMEGLHLPKDGQVMMALGKLTSMVDPESIKLIESIYQDVKEDIARMRPSSVVNTSPAESVIDSSTLGAALADLQQEELGLSSAIEQITTLIANKDAQIEHFLCYGQNDHYRPASGSQSVKDLKAYALVSSPQGVAGREREVGATLEFSPADFDFDKRVEIKAKNVDERAQAIRTDMAMKLYFLPNGEHGITRRQFHEGHGITNVDAHMSDLNVDTVTQRETPDRLQQVHDAIDRMFEVEFGLIPGTTAGVGILPEGGSDGATPDGGGGGGGLAGGGTQTNAPVVPQPEVTAQG